MPRPKRCPALYWTCECSHGENSLEAQEQIYREDWAEPHNLSCITSLQDHKSLAGLTLMGVASEASNMHACMANAIDG